MRSVGRTFSDSERSDAEIEGIAVNYALKHCEALTNFTKAGHLDASNNYVERCMRTVAVGRKAFLFVGSGRDEFTASNIAHVG